MINRSVLGAGFLAAGAVWSPRAATAEFPATAEHVAFVSFPTFLTHAPGDFERVFVLEKAGRIRVIKDGELVQDPFLDIDGLVAGSMLEQGLLGLAFHPDYQENGLFYVYYASDPDGDRVLARYQVTEDPDIADPGSASPVLSIAASYQSHFGGWLGFGPLDGFLYVSVGDAGIGLDQPDNAQNLDVLLGKMLRIDVNSDQFPEDEGRNYAIPADNPLVGAPGADEIWAWGLRNPWRCSFDRATGDLYIGDVGPTLWEELNYQPAGSPGGRNYGWDCKQGTHCTNQQTCDCTDGTLTDPILDYPHEGPLSAVIGGYVYRGCAVPELEGAFIFGDWGQQRVRLMRHEAGSVTLLEEIQDDLDPDDHQVSSVTSFGEDAYGELYICDSAPGEIFKIVSVAPPLPDCNIHGVRDACELADATAADADGDGVLDACDPHCPPDLNADDEVGITDLLELLAMWGADPGGPYDLDGSGGVGTGDLLTLLGAWGPCGSATPAG